MEGPLGLVMVASACFGGAAAPTSRPATHVATVGQRPQPYARFHIRATYASGSTNHFGGDLHRVRFALVCRRPQYYKSIYRRLPWQARLCLAILDYRTQARVEQTECFCPASPITVDIRGAIRGRSVHERFTPCLCGDGPAAAADVRAILRAVRAAGTFPL